jgi:Rod binding domain-containing protein
MSVDPIAGAAAGAIPPGVKDPKAYSAALGFERMLLEQLTKPMANSALGTGDSTDSEHGSTDDSGAAVYGDLISTGMAQSVSEAGGLGLAASLYKSFGAEGQ